MQLYDILFKPFRLNRNKSVFPRDAFPSLAFAEASHWWFKARNQIILWALRTRVYGIKNFLEVGCGTGYVIHGIAQEYPLLALEASEYFQEGLAFARKRVPKCCFRQLDATCMTDNNRYDCIGAFDVLEHIDDDISVLSNFYRALHSSGYLLLTVPQHPWLWSSADVYACHARRYTYSGLRRKLLSAGFKVCFHTSFVGLLLPLMIWQRLLLRKKSYELDDEFNISPLINACLWFCMQVEFILLKHGVRFPAGGSLLVVAKKNDSI